MAAWKVAPALAAGCTVVLKPSELSPMIVGKPGIEVEQAAASSMSQKASGRGLPLSCTSRTRGCPAGTDDRGHLAKSAGALRASQTRPRAGV